MNIEKYCLIGQHEKATVFWSSALLLTEGRVAWSKNTLQYEYMWLWFFLAW